MDFGSIRPFARFVRQLEYLPDTVSPPSFPMDARLFFVSSGEGRIEAGERVITMPAGSILFLNAGVPYRLLPCSAVYIAVNFDFTWAHSDLETPIPPLNLNTAAPKPPLERLTFPALPCFDTVCFYPEFHHAKVKLLQLALEYSKQLPIFRQEMSAILLTMRNCVHPVRTALMRSRSFSISTGITASRWITGRWPHIFTFTPTTSVRNSSAASASPCTDMYWRPGSAAPYP